MANKFAHASRTPYDPNDPSFVPPEQMLGDYAKEVVHGPAPDEYLAPVGTDYAARLMAQYGDVPGAASLMGVRPRPTRPAPKPMYQNPDIYVGGQEPAPAQNRTLRPLAPQAPNWLPNVRNTGVT